ncbi:MAG: hypothetical protein K2I42_04915 [Anaeroplasmataceae bacterium]|nr:hypothetical protein [Anaeroplasmataceae bacterium]
MDLGESNEIFYSKVRGGTTSYDVVVPSDYMVEKMYKNNMLSKIDFTKLKNFSKDNLMTGVVGIADTLEQKASGVSSYYVPYLWGTWGIMYSTLKDGLEKAVTASENQWSSLFDRSSLPAGTRVAMYDSHLHAYYAACRYLGIQTDEPLEKKELNQIYNLVKKMNFDAWGTDDIKKDIVAKNKDLGFMWTGDFLYYYSENTANVVLDAYLAGDVKIEDINSMVEILTGKERIYKEKYQIGFDIFIPEDTVAFCDNFVIPKDASHKDLAHQFIDFMIGRSEGENQVDPGFANTYYVSYNTPYKDIYQDIRSLKDVSFTLEDEAQFKSERTSKIDAYDSSLYWKIYDMAIGIAFGKYYKEEENILLPDGSIKKYRGDILPCFERNYINQINTTFNNARA